MVGYTESPGEREEDSICRSLDIPAQRQTALKIKRAAGMFPWKIANRCSETRWTQKLLDKFVEVINKSFPGGKLSEENVKQLRIAISNRMEPKPMAKQQCLLVTDLHEVMRELMRSNSHNKTMNGTTDKRRCSSSARQSFAAKRARTQEEEDDDEEEVDETTISNSTRSSRRLKGEPTDIMPGELTGKPRGISKRRESTAHDKEEQAQQEAIEVCIGPDDMENRTDGDDLVSLVGFNRTPTPNAVSTPRSPSTGPVQVDLLMSDEKIVQNIRRKISFIARQEKFANDKQLKDVEAERKACAQKRQKACDLKMSLNYQKKQFSASHEKAKKDVEIAEYKWEKITTALAPCQELKAQGAVNSTMLNVVDILEANIKEATFDYQKAQKSCIENQKEIESLETEIAGVERSIANIEASLGEILKRKINLENKYSAQRKFEFNIHMGTDPGHKDAHWFQNSSFSLEAVAYLSPEESR